MTHTKATGVGLVLLIVGGVAAYLGAVPATTHAVANVPWGSASYEDVSLLPMVGAAVAMCGIVLMVRGFMSRKRP